MMKITLRQLEVFAAVAAHGQVTRAAQAVALTQAAASMALADLEHQLGMPLFHRHGRQWQLTDGGREALALARDVLDRVDDIESIAAGQHASFDLRLGASVTIGNHLVPGLLATLKRQHPAGRIQVSRHNTEQVAARLRSFQIDLGMIEGPVHDASIRCLPWRHDELKVFVAPDHPLAHQEAGPEVLSALSWVVRERGSGTREHLDRALQDAGITPQIALELEQPEAVRQCVRLGLGAGCLSLLELHEAFQARVLAPVHTPTLALTRPLRLALHADKHLTRGIRAVLQACGVDADTPARPAD